VAAGLLQLKKIGSNSDSQKLKMMSCCEVELPKKPNQTFGFFFVS